MQALLSMLTYLGVCKSKNISGFFLLRVGCHSLLPALEALRDSGELTGAAIQAHKEDTLGFTQNVGIEAIAVIGVVITSSPGPIDNPRRIISIASNPLATPMQ